MSAIWTDSLTGPASYSTGGFTVTTTLSTVDAFAVNVDVVGANLPAADFDIALNSPGAGQVTIKVMRRAYDKITALGDPTGLPAGVSLATSNGQSYVSNTTHTHTMDHDHAATTSSTPTAGGTGVNTTLGSGNQSAHTHSFDPPNFTGSTGAGSGHTHTWNNIYQHQHSVTNTATDVPATELSAGVNLSGTTFNYFAVKN